MSKTMTLTRKQLERIITLIGIDQRVAAITIEERHISGVGSSHFGTFHYKEPGEGFNAELTDVEQW